MRTAEQRKAKRISARRDAILGPVGQVDVPEYSTHTMEPEIISDVEKFPHELRMRFSTRLLTEDRPAFVHSIVTINLTALADNIHKAMRSKGNKSVSGPIRVELA